MTCTANELEQVKKCMKIIYKTHYELPHSVFQKGNVFGETNNTCND